MKMRSISGVVCYVTNLERTIDFYKLLGFRFDTEVTDRATCYVNWFWIDFQLREGAEKPGGQGVCISVEDVDEFYEAVLTKGLQPESEPIDQPWGRREFAVVDPDGYTLIFFEK